MSLVVDPYRFAAGDTFVMPYRQEVVPWSSAEATSGMTFTRVQLTASSTVQAFSAGRVSPASLADADNGDYFEWVVNLAAGTWTFEVIAYKDSNSGIFRLSLDGTSIGTGDLYVLGGTHNNVFTFTGVTVAADGNYTLRLAAEGKNASSGDYTISIQYIDAIRTGS